MRLHFTGEITDLLPGIRELQTTYGFTFCESDGFPVTVRQQDGGRLSVRIAEGRGEIVYDKKIHFFRALGLLLEHQNETDFFTEETAYFTLNGPMFDLSHANAVINLKASKDIIRRMAVMGLNMLMMYCEDNYYVPERPYFGYMRPRYTDDELRELDDYCDLFGIEMIPCIQTLAHLMAPLKWKPFHELREDSDSLLVGEESTYQFIREMLVAASRPFRSKRIHIGMDEAMALGRGRYQDLHGVVSKTKIMLYHLNRVMEIVRELGLQPMMWSDMFFRAASKTNEYYDTDGVVFTDEVKSAVPKDVQLVYWDYYHNDVEDFYNQYIDLHRELSEPVFAGGIWMWDGFGVNVTKTLRTTNPALMACKRKGVKEVFATTWGDNLTECSIHGALFGLSLYAEHGYSFDLDMEKYKRRFEFCCGVSWEDCMNLQYIDEIPGIPEGNLQTRTPAKYLMWQDILTGLFDANIAGLPLQAHYERLTETLLPATERNGAYNLFFRYAYHVARVLAKKAEMGLRLTAAYRDGDRPALRRIAEEDLPELKARVQALHETHRAHWFELCKPLGWEMMDLRYGWLLTRIDTAILEVRQYLDGTLERLEELDEERLPYNGEEGLSLYPGGFGNMIAAGFLNYTTVN